MRPHKTRRALVGVNVDEGIADFVAHLNTLDGISTEASCEGTLDEADRTTTYPPNVFVTWRDDAALDALAPYRPMRVSYGAYVFPESVSDADRKRMNPVAAMDYP